MIAKGRDSPIVPLFGLDHWKGKLADDQVRAIYMDHREGTQIAKELQVHPGVISGIRLGKTHTHLTASVKRLFCERLGPARGVVYL